MVSTALGLIVKNSMKTRRLWQLSTKLTASALVILAMTITIASVLTHAATNSGQPPAWAVPSAMAVHRISPVASAQNEPNLLDNLDCSLVTYRQAATSTMQTGCFTDTAFGLLDSDSDTVIFNGTDEGLPLLSYSPHQVLAPWPRAVDLVALDAVNTGGSYISLYKNPLAVIQDQRNFLLQLTAKQLTAPPELALKDASGQRLIINAQTLTFSDGGSWLAAETLGGSFVRINLASLDITAFAPSFGAQGSPALLKSRVAVSDDGHYVAIYNDAASSFKVYDLATCNGTTSSLQPQNCKSYNYRPFIQSQISGFQSIRHLRFVNNGLLSFEATSSNPNNGGVYELAPTESITSLIDYLGLGDSYTSGEGAFDYLADTDSINNMCHLSARSYPLLLTHDLFSAIGGHSVACSGAEINDVGSTNDNYRGQVKGVPSFQEMQQVSPALLTSVMTNFAPGYVAQHRFVRQYQPGITTVSVGGNDIGFGDIIQNCVEPHISLHLSDGTCFNTYEDRLELTKLIDRTKPRWTALYKQLLAAAPGTRLYAIGYPKVVADTGSCALNAHLGRSELEFAQELIDYLNEGIKQAAGKAEVVYVDISEALAGHRLCETASYNVAVNGLTAGKDGGVLGIPMFGKESYHPNALGQALIEQAILKQTHNLTEVTPTTTATTNNESVSQALLKAPKTGRAIHTRVPDSSLTARRVKAGKSTVVKVKGSRDGLKAKAVYTLRLDGTAGVSIGSATSDEEGNIDTSVTIPSGTVPGGHTIDVTGENQAGEPVDVTQPVYVPVSDSDSDGDGTDDPVDSCPLAVNSGEDSDHDGIDDSCDPLIGSPPEPVSSAGSGNSTSNIGTGTAISPSADSPGNSPSGGQTGTSTGLQSGDLFSPPVNTNNGSPGGSPAANQISTTVTNANPPSTSGTLNTGSTTVTGFTMNMGPSAAAFTSLPISNVSKGQTVAHISSTFATNAKLSSARLLGAATTNPTTVMPKTFKPLATAKQTSPHVPFPALRTINWLPWILLPVISWLLLLAIMGLRQLAKRSSQTEHSPLKPKISTKTAKF